MFIHKHAERLAYTIALKSPSHSQVDNRQIFFFKAQIFLSLEIENREGPGT